MTKKGIVLIAVMVLLVGCAGSATSQATATQAGGADATPAGGGAPSQPPVAASVAASPAGGGTAGGASDSGGGPIGGDVGDRSKGSAQARISGGLTASVDLPFGAPAAQLLTQGPGTAYLPFTDPVDGTLFLTISGDQLLVQYAGPNNVGLTNGATPCELKLDALDAGQAKGTFTCKGMLLIQGDAMGNADMSGSFEAHR
jgi:hypothetical protein